LIILGVPVRKSGRVADSKNYNKKEEGSLEEKLLKGDISILQKR